MGAIPIGLAIMAVILFVTFKDKPKVKCNISASGNKIYHIPGDKLYKVTKIDKSQGEFYAWTETEALEKGFKRSGVR